MDFNQKLQELRKKKGLTQEELSEALYVSRAAISKWESGRGYPSIESLKAIAAFFSITVDDLLSADEVLTIAKEDSRKKEVGMRGVAYGLFDISCALLFLLPIFGQRGDEEVLEVLLFSLCGISPYLKAAYYSIVCVTVLFGIITLALLRCTKVRADVMRNISITLSTCGILLFISSLQAYAASLMLVFLIIKVFMLIKIK